jgi:prepilin-type N-terminal cleavage/methylation domain-containing protein
MNIADSRRTLRGVTLIELMCVIAIIAVLATLFLGSAGRVLKRMRAADWEDKASAQLGNVADQLKRRFQGQTEFPLMTLEKLEADGTLYSGQISFLKNRRVVFTPFSGADPEGLVIVAVRIESGFLTSAGTLTLTKGDVTRVPR